MTTLASICNRSVAFTTGETTVTEAARLMRKAHVGSLVIVDQLKAGKRVPVGIVTDRDIVVEVVATGLDPNTLTAGDIMERDLAVSGENRTLLEALHIMRARGARRLPVVDADGQLAGIVTVDDVLEVLASGLQEVTKIAAREQSRESATRR